MSVKEQVAVNRQLAWENKVRNFREGRVERAATIPNKKAKKAKGRCRGKVKW
jgi:hypothetical protein